MKKSDLAHILCYCAGQAGRTKYDIMFVDIDNLCGEYDAQSLMEFASNCAGVTLKKGRMPLKGRFLASRGQELPYKKPEAVIEYSRHWPWDYCYIYRV